MSGWPEKDNRWLEASIIIGEMHMAAERLEHIAHCKECQEKVTRITQIFEKMNQSNE